MTMLFEELNETRAQMLQEFLAEQNGPNPYYGQGLAPAGLKAFVQNMERAIKEGNEQGLASAMLDTAYWNPKETYVRKGVASTRNVNIQQASERLAQTEFNTWYVRGLAKRLLDEGVLDCQVYRASEPKWSPAECSEHEGKKVSVREVYNGHRVRYWPAPGNPNAFSVPFNPGCHHSIRRIKNP